MKCPHCGHWNQPSFPRCFKCGAPLDAKDAAAPAWREKFEKPHKDKIRVLYDDADAQPTVEEFASVPPELDSKEETLSEEMLRLKDRRERGEKYLETLREQTAREEKTDGRRTPLSAKTGTSSLIWTTMRRTNLTTTPTTRCTRILCRPPAPPSALRAAAKNAGICAVRSPSPSGWYAFLS